LDNGLQRLHIRKLGYTEQQMETYIKQIPVKWHNKIVVHHHSAIAQQFNLGLHVSFNNFFSYTQHSHSSLSVSVHSRDEFEKVDGKCNYAFISPVFNSISKVGYVTNATLIGMGNQQRTTALIALGGITNNNIAQIQQAGFDGAAIIGSVWQTDDAVKSFIEIQNAITT
jgi:thiamine-phosphate pyrophosphorylase